MKLYHIVAVADGGVIGKGNKLPWHFSEDLKFFKKQTVGSTIIMGRKTWESIEKPLPERINFVLSRSQFSESDNPRFFKNLGEAFSAIKTEKAFIIGGAQLYRETSEIVDGIYLTKVHGQYDGDAFYPQIPKFFKEISREILRQEPLLEAIYYEKIKGGGFSCGC